MNGLEVGLSRSGRSACRKERDARRAAGGVGNAESGDVRTGTGYLHLNIVHQVDVNMAFGRGISLREAVVHQPCEHEALEA